MKFWITAKVKKSILDNAPKLAELIQDIAKFPEVTDITGQVVDKDSLLMLISVTSRKKADEFVKECLLPLGIQSGKIETAQIQ